MEESISSRSRSSSDFSTSDSSPPVPSPSPPPRATFDFEPEDEGPSSTIWTRPRNRPRGLSLPASQHTASGPGLLSYLPTGYALQSLQALDLDLPTLPSHLTYTSLRSSLLSHITELERRVLKYYSKGSVWEDAVQDDQDEDLVPGKGKEREKSPIPTSDEEDDDDLDESTTAPRPLPPSLSSSSYFPSTSRAVRSTSSSSLTPDLLLAQLSLLRTEVLTYLPSLSTLSSQLPSLPRLPPTPQLPQLPYLPNGTLFSPSSPFPPTLDFLSSLPGRLDHLHSSVKKIPIPSSLAFPASISGSFPEFSLAPTSTLGMGAKQVFDLLDAILPPEMERRGSGLDGDDGGEGGDEEEGMMFPVFPNRTPRHWRAFERRRKFTLPSTNRTTSHRRTPSSLTGGERTEGDEDETEGEEGDGEEGEGLMVGGGLMRVLSREIGADGKVEVEVLEEVAEGPTVEIAVRKAREAEGVDGLGDGLIEFVDLPGMWQNNEFIVGGYRFIPIEDWPKLVRSLFAVHNETVNIHSHLVSSVLVLLSIPYFIYSTPFTSATPPATFDTVVLLFFLLAAFKCLFCSATWHLFAGCATKRYFLTFACVDYLGISWLIAASVNSVVYFGFYQHPTPMAVYGLLNLVVGVAGSILPFQRWFNQRHNKHLRILFFLGMAFSALAPIAHMILLNSLPRTLMFLRPLAPSLSSYFFGLWFYANHYPESRWPGMFDRIGASHNIWHGAIVCAIAFHFRGVMELYKQKDVYSLASATIFLPGTMQTWWEAVRVVLG